MARIRSIKPEARQDAKLAKVSRETRLTFWYLIVEADDQGYFRATLRTLLGSLYPHDPDITERMLVAELDALLHVGLIRCFDTPDGPLGQVTNFTRHQKIDHPSKAFLANLSRSPRETFAPGVLSLDLGVQEQSKRSSSAREGLAEPDDVRDALPEEARETYDGYLRQAQMPVAVRQSLRAVAEGMHGKPLSWETIGRALVAMAAANVSPYNERALAGFAGKLTATEREEDTGMVFLGRKPAA